MNSIEAAETEATSFTVPSPPLTRRCFVISPIGEEGTEVRRHADAVYRYIIRPAMAQCGIDAIRSDHLSEPGMISKQMIDHIISDHVCIAVLTGHNPNVFYELGVAHASRRPVVMLVHKGESLPFDVKDMRCVQYDLTPAKFAAYQNDVVEQIQSMGESGWQGATPLHLLSASAGHLAGGPVETQIQAVSESVDDFFGLGGDRSLSLVVCSFQHVVPYAPVEHDEEAELAKSRYFKVNLDGSRHFVIGAHDHVIGVKTMHAVASVYKAARRLPIVVDAIADEVILSGGRGLTDLPSGVFLAIGSASTNKLTQMLWMLGAYRTNPLIYEFHGTDQLRQLGGEDVRYATSDTDYAVITKYVLEERTFFVCAGIDEEGTTAASSFLLEHWEALYDQAGSSGFFNVYRVEKALSPSSKAMNLLSASVQNASGAFSRAG